MTKKSKDAEIQRPESPAPNPLAYGAALIAFGEGVLRELSALNIPISSFRHLRAQLDVLKEGQAEAEKRFAPADDAGEPVSAQVPAPAEPSEPGQTTDQTSLQV